MASSGKLPAAQVIDLMSDSDEEPVLKKAKTDNNTGAAATITEQEVAEKELKLDDVDRLLDEAERQAKAKSLSTSGQLQTAVAEGEKSKNAGIATLQSQLEKYAANFYVRELPRERPTYTGFPELLSANVQGALREQIGIDRLYSHQSETFRQVVEKHENVFLCTSFASGKSLAYTLPLLHEWDLWHARFGNGVGASTAQSACSSSSAFDNRPRAFLLFPTKALAQDQCQKLKKFEQLQGKPFWKVTTFDGDTAFSTRKQLLQSCDLFLTNPDTLHCFFLKEFRKNKEVQNVLLNLRFLVLDEAHVYTGRFGAHVSCVLRRLRRAIEKTKQMHGLLEETKNAAGRDGAAGLQRGQSAASGSARAKAKAKAKAKSRAGAARNKGPIVKLNGTSASSSAVPPTNAATATASSATGSSLPFAGLPKSNSGPPAPTLEPEQSKHLRFIACSATMVRPLEFFHELVDLDVTVISDSGAGRGSKQVCLWTPTMRARNYELYEPDAEKRKRNFAKQKAKKIEKTNKQLNLLEDPTTVSSAASTAVGSATTGSSATTATTSLHDPMTDKENVDSFHHMNDGIYDDIAWSFVQAVKKGIKTVLFVSARSLVELMLDRICERIRKDASLVGNKKSTAGDAAETVEDFLNYDGRPSEEENMDEGNNNSAAGRVRNMKSPETNKRGQPGALAKKTTAAAKAAASKRKSVSSATGPGAQATGQLGNSSSSNNAVHSAADELIGRIASYRAGYSKEIRRDIEQKFFNNKLIGLVATNALELGIDVGDLQCTIHLGIPRQLSSLWQQMGRGGRGFETDSLAIVITLPISGVDAYYMENPDEFFSRRDPVCALFIPPDITRDHLFCAMSEYPGKLEDYLELFWKEKSFRPMLDNGKGTQTGLELQQQDSDADINPGTTKAALATISSTSQKAEQSLTPLVTFDDIYAEFPFRFYRDPKTQIVDYCAPPKEKNAHSRFNIREIEIQYDVWDAEDYSSAAVPLDSLEESVAYVKLYRGAIYRIQRETYIVEDLDTTNQWAVVRKHIGEPLKYYTRAKDRVEVFIHSQMREVLGENLLEAEKKTNPSTTTMLKTTANVPPGTSSSSTEQQDQNDANNLAVAAPAAGQLPSDASTAPAPPELHDENLQKKPQSYVKIFNQLHVLYRGPLTTFLFVTGYHKLNKADGQVEDTIDLKMAPLKRYHTGIWLDLGILARLHPAGLHVLEHVMCLLAPVFGITEPLKAQHNRGMKKGGDGSGENDHGEKLLLYPYSRTLAENFALLLECSAERIFTCECEKGCPKCIMDSSCYQGGLDKEDGKELLRKLGYDEWRAQREEKLGSGSSLAGRVIPDMRVETITRSMA
ncbi:unnamed protein product [Amoebophrya sp. A120]|nr:unnamed protein product [Amoebophrya sp. A120]|eukprot:GSA120T00004069001.1